MDDLVWKMFADDRQFAESMVRSANNSRKLTAEMDRTIAAQRSFSLQSVKGVADSHAYMMAIQQLSYGVEDAATQFGTMGLSGAIRGMSNNLSAAGMMFGPTTALAASLGSTALLLGTQFLEAGAGAKTLASELKTLREEYYSTEKAAQRARDATSHGFAVQDAKGVQNTQAAIEGARQSERKIAEVQASIEARTKGAAQKIRESFDAQQKEMESRIPALESAKKPRQFVTDTLNFFGMKDSKQTLAEIRSRLEEINKLRKLSDAELLGKAIPSPLYTVGQKEHIERTKAIEAERQSLKDLRAEQKQQAELQKTFAGQVPEQARRAREAELLGLKDAMRAALDSVTAGGGKKVFEDNPQTISDLKKVQGYWESTRKPAEKYADTIREIRRLEKTNLLDPITAARAAQKAREEMQQELDKGLHADAKITLTPYVDARSPEALSNYYKALYSNRRDQPLFQPTAPPMAPPMAPPAVMPVKQENHLIQRRDQIERDLTAVQNRELYTKMDIADAKATGDGSLSNLLDKLIRIQERAVKLQESLVKIDERIAVQKGDTVETVIATF